MARLAARLPDPLVGLLPRLARAANLIDQDRPQPLGDVVAPLTVGSDSFVIAKVPEGASTGELVVSSGDRSSQTWACDVGIPIGEL